ncbi:hypothetical protein GCM10011348_38250 [Marinobacterium nitratireducens]|uniref:Uncharacterized protein n=1 Tax=Marinobacterium nitratireducens TaxID=518897 RepID=A0A918DX48_9GAMM|nr:hypothetical protein GCM10011348_38250 [Marinobacterium nitratireducens]
MVAGSGAIPAGSRLALRQSPLAQPFSSSTATISNPFRIFALRCSAIVDALVSVTQDSPIFIRAQANVNYPATLRMMGCTTP